MAFEAAKLNELHLMMRSSPKDSKIVDAKAYAGDIEDLDLRAWEAWCEMRSNKLLCILLLAVGCLIRLHLRKQLLR